MLGEIGENIRKFRKQAGMTQIELSDAIKVTDRTIRFWEQGITSPTAPFIQKLCEVLHCTESELLNGPKSKEITVTVRIGRIEEVNDMMIDLGNANGFGMVLDTRGAVGIGGAAMFDFESDTELEDTIAKIGNTLRTAWRVQREQNRK